MNVVEQSSEVGGAARGTIIVDEDRLVTVAEQTSPLLVLCIKAPGVGMPVRDSGSQNRSAEEPNGNRMDGAEHSQFCSQGGEWGGK